MPDTQFPSGWLKKLVEEHFTKVRKTIGNVPEAVFEPPLSHPGEENTGTALSDNLSRRGEVRPDLEEESVLSRADFSLQEDLLG